MAQPILWAAQLEHEQRAAGAQDAAELAERKGQIADMAEAVAHADQIEAAAGERERFGLAQHQLVGGTGPAGLGQHPLARIEPDDQPAASQHPPRLAGDLAGADRDVEHAHPGRKPAATSISRR